jgi:S-adenosylmethionine decarboxylase proenzyme
LKESLEEHELKTYGRHILVEFFGCDEAILDNVSRVEEVMRAAVKASGATEVGCVFHKFQPQGTSGVIVLSESHISIHTWPGDGYASVDFYTCGDCDPHAGVDILLEGFNGTSYELLFVERGQEGKKTSMTVANHTTRQAFRPSLMAGGAE